MFGQKNLIRSLYFELKNQGLYFLVPPFILFVVVPLAILATIKGAAGSFGEAATISQLFIPSFSAWWPLFLIKEYLHSPGKELFFVYRFRENSLANRMFLLWAVYTLLVLILFSYLTSLFEFVWFLFVAIAIQCLFMIALGYFLSLAVHNTFIPLLVNFSYTSVFMLAILDSPLSIFQIGSFSDASSMSGSAITVIVISVLLYTGLQVERRLYRNSV